MTQSNVMTKADVLKSLTKQLRREDLDDLSYLKLLKVYGQLSGWRV